LHQWYGELNEKDLGLKGWAEPDYDDADWENDIGAGSVAGYSLGGSNGFQFGCGKSLTFQLVFLQDDMLLRLWCHY